MEFVLKNGWFKDLLRDSGVIPIFVLFCGCCGIFVFIILNIDTSPSDEDIKELTDKIDVYVSNTVREEIQDTRYRSFIVQEIKEVVDETVRDISGGVLYITDEYVLVKAREDDCYSYRHGEYVQDTCFTAKEARDMLDNIIAKDVYRTRYGKEWDDIKFEDIK